jgi:hypothetical protein
VQIRVTPANFDFRFFGKCPSAGKNFIFLVGFEKPKPFALLDSAALNYC